jgi:hypothetical protein
MRKKLTNKVAWDLFGVNQEIKDSFGEQFDLLNETILSAARHGVSLATNALRDQTKQNISTSWFNSSTSRYGVGLIEGVQAFMYKGAATGVIAVLGNSRVDDGTWRLRFFENGTKPRQSKHGKNYGSIRPAYFFANAKSSVNVMDIINDTIQKAIDEINN